MTALTNIPAPPLSGSTPAGIKHRCLNGTVIVPFSGIDSEAAAIVFIVAYALLTPVFLLKTFKKCNLVHLIVNLFCAVRVTAFVLRAIIAGSDTAAHNLSLIITFLILVGVGFTFLLSAVFNLQLDREHSAGLRYENRIGRIFSNKMLCRLFLTTSTGLTVSGIVMTFSDLEDRRDTGLTLRKAGTWMIPALTILQVLRALAFVRYELASARSSIKGHSAITFGDRHAALILSIISGLFLMRMIYAVITITSQTQEKLWYPLSALSEILGVCLLAAPGLVLSTGELWGKRFGIGGYNNRPFMTPTVL